MFSTGECLCFKLANGNYGGAVVLASGELGLNLIASTKINQPSKPTINDFKNADVLMCTFGNLDDKPKITWYYAPLPKNDPPSLEIIGSMQIEIPYDSKEVRHNIYPFHPSYTGNWAFVIESVNLQIEHEKTNPPAKNKLTIAQLARKKKWWDVF